MRGHNLDNDAATLSMQPAPTFTRILHLPIGRPTSTAINRGFDKAEIGRCKLCRACTAGPLGTCLVGVNRVVTEEEARLLSDRDYQWFQMPTPPAEVRAQTS